MSIFAPAKLVLKRSLDSLGLEIRRSRPLVGSAGGSSNFGEEGIIRDLLEKIGTPRRFCVDIGAGDGQTSSNSFFLFHAGWEGLAAEWDGGRFAKLAYRYAGYSGARLCRARVTPDTVIALLSAYEVPKDFGFLSLDIDGYDHFVLENLLTQYRPALICAEINEKIPPPLKFTVKWYPEHGWTFDHFYGQSLSMLAELGKRQGYDLVGLEYNNAFLIPKEINPVQALTPEQAYRAGYLDRPDRLQKLPWNKDMEELQGMPAAEAVKFLGDKFSKYAGKYILEAR